MKDLRAGMGRNGSADPHHCPRDRPGRIKIDNNQPPARLEHPTDLTKTGALQIGREVMQHEARNDDIKTIIVERQPLDDAEIEGRAAARARSVAARGLDHPGTGVDTDRDAVWPDGFGGKAHQHSSAAADVEHPVARLELGDR